MTWEEEREDKIGSLLTRAKILVNVYFFLFLLLITCDCMCESNLCLLQKIQKLQEKNVSVCV